jgi:CRISPR system Cascade subunit CasA
LSTLAVPRRKLPNSEIGTTLWDLVWANTPAESWSKSRDLVDLFSTDDIWPSVFPWLKPTRTSENDKGTSLDDAHRLQHFFGMPCRIRLGSLNDEAAIGCALDGPLQFGSYSDWSTRQHGVKYEGMLHPLSPYKIEGKGAKTAVHYRQGVGTYQDWLNWAVGPLQSKQERAFCIVVWEERLKALGSYKGHGAEFDASDTWQSGVYACGYDFKQNKARAWLEARIPYFDPPPGRSADEWAMHFRRLAALLVASAEVAANALLYQVRLATFGARKKNGDGYELPKKSPGKKSFAELIERFWRETEIDFSEALKALRGTPDDPERSVRDRFLLALRRKALRLFDDIASTDDLADQDARRIVEARSQLQYVFNQTGRVRGALDLITADAKQKVAKRRAAKKKPDDSDRKDKDQ